MTLRIEHVRRVFGQRDGSWVDEDSETAPSSPTARILLEGEALARAHGTVVRLSGIVDGTSVTLITGEVLQGAASDARGAIWTLAGLFTTRFTPNGLKDFYGVREQYLESLLDAEIGRASCRERVSSPV